MSGEAAPKPNLEPQAERRTGTLFGITFAITAVLIVLIVWIASSGPRANAASTLRIIITGLVVNGGLSCALIALVGQRVLAVLRSRDVGSRLHLRYMSLFAAAAVVPAIVVAFFFGLLVNRGIEGWFATPFETITNNYDALSEQVQTNEQEGLNPEINGAKDALDSSLSLLRTSPQAYEQVLKRQLLGWQFKAIHVIDIHGQVLAQAESSAASPYVPPDSKSYVDADAALAPRCRVNTPPADCILPYAIDAKTDSAYVLLPLAGTPHPYVFIEVSEPPGLWAKLYESKAAVAQYRQVEKARGNLQAVFIWIYTETVLLVLLAAIWLGMAVANSISEPVAKLIEAANRVAGGDLKARVPTDSSLEEINALSRSFNQMTGDLDGQTSALIAAGKDAENRRNFIETVLSGVSAGVIGLDSAGRISAFNNQALRLLDITEAQARGKALGEVAPELLEVAERAGETGSGAEAELNVLRGTLTRRLRVRAGGDAHDGLVLTFDDITRLVAAQRNAAWRDVARRIAHEIKNPLTPIQLSAERLRRKYRKEVISDVETFDRCTETIIRQVGDIGRMVDEFSAFARMPAPKITTCDASELLREAIFARRVANPDIEIVAVEEMDGDPIIQCDERMIAQALTNILKNAAEAVSARTHAEPGHHGRIVATLRRQDEFVLFEVEDNGVGLPEEGRDRLIEPYVTTREKGTGLGLAIVGRILEDHGGSLTLSDARAGRGALVVIALPQDEQSRSGQPQTQIPIEQM